MNSPSLTAFGRGEVGGFEALAAFVVPGRIVERGGLDFPSIGCSICETVGEEWSSLAGFGAGVGFRTFISRSFGLRSHLAGAFSHRCCSCSGELCGDAGSSSEEDFIGVRMVSFRRYEDGK